jgi:hypothetical protein
MQGNGRFGERIPRPRGEKTGQTSLSFAIVTGTCLGKGQINKGKY